MRAIYLTLIQYKKLIQLFAFVWIEILKSTHNSIPKKKESNIYPLNIPLLLFGVFLLEFNHWEIHWRILNIPDTIEFKVVVPLFLELTLPL